MSAAGVDAVVLLHGQPDTSAAWGAVRARLQGAPGIPVRAPDRPGYGTNRLPATDYPGNVEWLHRFLDGTGLDRVVLVAHSWAGGVALLAAARHPPRIAAIVLVASVGPACLVPLDRPLAWPVVGGAVAWTGLGLAAPLLRRAARRHAAARLPPAEWAHTEMEIAAVRYQPLWRTFLVEQRALLRELPLLVGALAEVRTPTIVLAGDRDTTVPKRTAQLLTDGIPGAELRTIAGATHDLPRRAPDAVADAIRDAVALVRRS